MEEEAGEVVEAGDATEAPAAPADGNGNGNGNGGGMEDMDPVTGLTMVLMTIDSRIGILYNDILAELDEEKRMKASDELQNLKV